VWRVGTGLGTVVNAVTQYRQSASSTHTLGDATPAIDTNQDNSDSDTGRSEHTFFIIRNATPNSLLVTLSITSRLVLNHTHSHGCGPCVVPNIDELQLSLTLLATATSCKLLLDYMLTPGFQTSPLGGKGMHRRRVGGLAVMPTSRRGGGRLRPPHHNQPDPWAAKMGDI
jgi:hypothetical protein